MPRRAALALALCLVVVGLTPSRAAAAPCSRAVVFTLPGVTWHDVARDDLPALERVMSDGAIASMSVRTNSSRTTYASGFATIGAGTRMDGGVTTGGTVEGDARGTVQAAGLPELRFRAADAGYDAVPGALGEAVGDVRTGAIGNAETSIGRSWAMRFQRWPLLAVMDTTGVVDDAIVGDELLEVVDGVVRTDQDAFVAATRDVLADPCIVAAIDHGDLIRAELGADPASIDDARRAALRSADDALGQILDLLDDDDLLLVVSPTSPLGTEVHFGVAMARGPGFVPGSIMSSASTRRDGIVTLPDVAPTILEHLGLERHPAMLGRPFFPVAAPADRIQFVLEQDDEATFVDRIRVPVTTSFVVGQVLIYLAIALVWFRRAGNGRTRGERWPELAALGVVTFPGVTYLAGALPQHELGLIGYVVVVSAVTAGIVVVVARALDHPLARLLAITGGTCALLVADVVTGARLQVNTVFSYSPLVAGRFAGFGNTAFAVLGAVTVITATLIVHRSGRSATSLWAAAVLFAVVVLVDGAPMWGSDVGGVLALVPGFAVTVMLLAGKRPNARSIALAAAATVAVLAALLLFDLARPPEQRTHLARLFEDIRSRGSDAFVGTVGRKIETNLRVFTSTIWTYFVPPALAFISWLLLRPRGRWERLAREYPTLRAGLIGGLVVSILGFAVNDSGIVVPAMVLSYLVPVALLIHMLLEREADA
ncbi:MAG TPA: hypothetical protein VG929_07245 [Actinomycetota bacterium]|nr:hypothetical protein [Actinomycetota bacterium]